MPWQQLVADVGGELVTDDQGRLVPAYREVVVTVPRQSGKTTIVLAWQLDRALAWAAEDGPQRIVYSAQTGKDAREKLVDDQFPILEPLRAKLEIRSLRRAIGSEAVVWRNGSQLVLLASGADSGHGKTVHLGVKDELFADTDFRRDQALVPAMATIPSAQLFTTSTAGTAESVALNAKVEAGRGSVDAGKREGIAYFEWSADPEADPGDPATWWSCMPALGRTINLAAVEHAYENMPLSEFRRAYLNIPTVGETQVIPATAWDLVCSPDVEAVADVFALDVSTDRDHAGIVACGGSDRPVLEVVDYRNTVGWLVPRAVELAQRYGAPFVVDSTGPAAAFVPELERAGVRVVQVAPKDMVRATGAFYDAVVNERVSIRRHAGLDLAVRGASKRPVGDAWTWGRKSSSVDVTLLVAASVALWHVHGAGAGQDQTVELFV